MEALRGEIMTFLLAATPLIESRVSIPFGVFVAELTPARAVLLTFFGAAMPALLATPFVYRFADTVRAKWAWFDGLLHKTQARHGMKFEEGKLIALFLFIAIPLPATGVWTGVLISYLVGIPLRIAMPVLVLGALIGSIAVGLIVAGAGGALRALFGL
jgi:uncharacterized membrane protein